MHGTPHGMSLRRRVLGALLSVVAKAYGTEADKRRDRLAQALGYDPKRFTVAPHTPVGQKKPGLRVLDKGTGKTVSFYSHGSLAKLRADPRHLRAWKAAG